MPKLRLGVGYFRVALGRGNTWADDGRRRHTMHVGQPPVAMPEIGSWVRLTTDEQYRPGKVILEFAPMGLEGDYDVTDFAPGEMGPGTTETWFHTTDRAEAFIAAIKTSGYDAAFAGLSESRGIK